MQEYYKILGLSEDATMEEIENAYNKLKNKYSKDRFLEGEAGNEAAKNLTKLEMAYAEIKEERKFQEAKSKSLSYAEIEQMIRDGKLNDAQVALDNITERVAEWHFLQSVLFYKKNWLNESKKQLEIAKDMDPNNQKYNDSYAKLCAKINSNNNNFNQNNFNNNFNSAQQQNQQMGGTDVSACLDCLLCNCLLNLGCSMCCR